MSVRMNLSVGDSLDAWITEKANELGVAKNAFVLMCVADARKQEENAKMMANTDLFKQLINLAQDSGKEEKDEKK